MTALKTAYVVLHNTNYAKYRRQGDGRVPSFDVVLLNIYSRSKALSGNLKDSL
jgi:hypothetical protein